jgi:hypothetical protein
MISPGASRPSERKSLTTRVSIRPGTELHLAAFPVTVIVDGQHQVVYPVANDQRHAEWYCDICNRSVSEGRRFAARKADVDVCEDCATSDDRTAEDILGAVQREMASLARISEKLERTVSRRAKVLDPPSTHSY